MGPCDSPIKIALFHTTLPSSGRKVGGVEVFVDRLASAFATKNFDVEVLSLDLPPQGHVYKHRQLFKRFQFLKRSRLTRLFVLPILLNFIDLKSYDIVHFHGDDWFYFVRPTATIRTMYGSALWEARSATRLKRKLIQYVVYPLEKLSCRLSNVTLAVGPEAAALYKADGLSDLFVSDKLFYERKKTEFPSFVFVGLWQGRKRGKFVADSFLNEVLPKYDDAKLFMACDFVPKEVGVIDLDSPSEVSLSETIGTSWALLSASTYEGFGIPYLEAITSGTVVVATRNAGAEYVLDRGKFGLIVEDQDFGKMLLHILENEDVRQHYERMGIEGAKRFSEERIIADHLNYYQLAIQRYHKNRD
jgi:glycosyltransferase involved in cell wall biosynthesis